MVAASAFLIMLKWGKQLRIRSAAGYWSLVEADKAKSQAN